MGVSEHRDVCRFVPLRGGLAVPIEAIELSLNLEARGFVLQREPGDMLSVQPFERLTADDCARIRRWKWHLLSLVDYAPPEVPQ